MGHDRAAREAARLNKAENTNAYFAFHAGRNRWQLRRQEPGGRDTTVIAQ